MFMCKIYRNVRVSNVTETGVGLRTHTARIIHAITYNDVRIIFQPPRTEFDVNDN